MLRLNILACLEIIDAIEKYAFLTSCNVIRGNREWVSNSKLRYMPLLPEFCRLGCIGV